MSALNGFDQYSASPRRVNVRVERAHIALSVEATSGSQVGEAMLTPDQALAIAKWLQQAAGETSLDYAKDEQ